MICLTSWKLFNWDLNQIYQFHYFLQYKHIIYYSYSLIFHAMLVDLWVFLWLFMDYHFKHQSPVFLMLSTQLFENHFWLKCNHKYVNHSISFYYKLMTLIAQAMMTKYFLNCIYIANQIRTLNNLLIRFENSKSR